MCHYGCESCNRLRRVYSTCTFCYATLGANEVLESFPVSRRVAFDPKKGCLWAICRHCAGWNLAPLEERWEAVEECERRFRGTALRYSSGNVGLAWLHGDVELIRVGPALRPEVAAWRYGRILSLRRSLTRRTFESIATSVLRSIHTLIAARGSRQRDPRAALAQTLLAVYGNRVIDLVHVPQKPVEPGSDLPVAVVRFKHLTRAMLVRPEPGQPWALKIPHDHGVLTVEGDLGIRAAARLLSVINGTERGGGFSHDLIESAVRKVDESAFTESYFNRVLAIALRSHWGRDAESTGHQQSRRVDALEVASSDVERLAFRLTGRTFWGQGGIGSEPSAALLDVPLVDRLALEMAAHEEAERRALAGELEEIAEAWREADEIATIADALIP